MSDRRRQDLIDYSNEIAGRETGRMKRFVLDSDESSLAGKERKERRTRDALSRLQLLLANDPVYAERHAEALSMLGNYGAAAESAISDVERERSRAREALQNAQDGASRLPDGRLVFQDQDGTALLATGERVPDLEAQSIEWRDGAVTFERYRKMKRDVDEAELRLLELRRYQVDVLGPARERLTDPEDPPDFDEIDDILQEIRKGAPEEVTSRIPNDGPSAPVPDDSVVPKL
ncbi:MAG: hypothetical protein AAFR03_00495 [Pseudomonadota bacterium]